MASTRLHLAALKPWDDDGLELLIRHQPRKPDAAGQSPSREYDDILTAFTEIKRAALLGAPGSGKSTTLRKLALELAQRALARPEAPLPLLVALGDWLGDESLSRFLAAHAPEIGWAAEALCKSNRLVLLLDGLNELPTAKRPQKAADLKGLCQRLEKLNARMAIVSSCRREDYVAELDLGFDTLTLEPLSPQRIRAALRQWIADRNLPDETADCLFWQLAGDERLSGVLNTWLSAGASEEVFWSASDPQEQEKVYKATTGEQDSLWRRHIPDPRSLLGLAW